MITVRLKWGMTGMHFVKICTQKSINLKIYIYIFYVVKNVMNEHCDILYI